MAKQLKKAGKPSPEDADDDISFLVDGDGGGVAFGESHSGFEFPKNLKDMTEEQKQKLHDEYVEYMKGTASAGSAFDVAELNPSEVLDPDAPKKKSKPSIKPSSLFSSLPDPDLAAAQLKDGGPFKWDSKNGFIVHEEDASTLAGREGADSIPMASSRAREIGADEARAVSERLRRAGLTDAQRDAEDRFSNL